jgi:hypothetical protein
LLWLRPRDELDPRRVVAGVLQNRTTDPSLDGAPRRPEHPAWHRTDRLSFHIHITVCRAAFIKLCSGTLDRLRARFERRNGIAGHEVEYDYVVE